MTKPLALSTRSRLGFAADPGAHINLLIGALGLGFVVAEGALLSARGTDGAVVVLTVVLAASTVSSIAGFAFSALCGALLFHIMDSPVYAVRVMIVCSMAMQMFSVASLWRSIDWRSLPVFLVGGVPGVPVGAWLLLHLQSDVYRAVMGGLLVAYGGYMLLRRPTRPLGAGPLWDAFAGFLGGLTGGLAGFPGAFVTIWCGLKGWDKSRQRGVYQPFILAMQPIALISIGLMRPAPATAAPLDWMAAAFVPAALLGTWFGLRIFRRLSDRQFEFAVSALLVMAGLGLML
jgi:uncharacterized membrane protein YfcA